MESFLHQNKQPRYQGETVPLSLIPPQYRGMHPDAVEIAWTIPSYVDEEKTAAELDRKKRALAYLREQQKETATDQPKTNRAEVAKESTPSIEKYLAQPNVQAAQAELSALLHSGNDIDPERVKNVIYNLLTKRAWLHVELQKRQSKDLTWMMETYKPQREWYRNTLALLESQLEETGFKTASNPGWFSVTASEHQSESVEHTSHKVYETISIQDYPKITELPKLVHALKAIGDETGERIKIKIPVNFNGFITHNDSIVVHCDSANTCHRVQQAIATWKRDHNLVPVERELNRATIAIDGKTQTTDGETESFSQLVASEIAAWIKVHTSNYTPDILAAEAIKHSILLAQQTPVTASTQ